MTIEQLERELLALPADERARLAERLIETLGTSPELEAAWAKEISKRLRDWEEGRIHERSWESVRAEIRERAGSE